MKARDGDAQRSGDLNADLRGANERRGPALGLCPSCKTEAPLKAGFRTSSQKCPKCGAALGKR